MTLASLAGCASQTTEPTVRRPVSFTDLPSWGSVAVLPALNAFAAACSHPSKICTDLANQRPRTEAAAVQFVQAHFQPFAIESPDGQDEGLFTGYYQPELNGALTRHAAFQTPVYARPKTSPPYPTRAEIDQGALQGNADILVWVDDPVAAFFMQVQGSGRIRLENGTVISLAYAGSNDMPYNAIGKTLVAQGWMQAADVNAGSIAAWLKQHPDKAQAIMESDARYVFFKIASSGSPTGAAGRPLIPDISLAVDPESIPLGSLVWLELDPGSGQKTPRLMLADDKGIAIKGAVRGDIYLGSGEAAGVDAGLLKAKGRYWLLAPAP